MRKLWLGTALLVLCGCMPARYEPETRVAPPPPPPVSTDPLPTVEVLKVGYLNDGPSFTYEIDGMVTNHAAVDYSDVVVKGRLWNGNEMVASDTASTGEIPGGAKRRVKVIVKVVDPPATPLNGSLHVVR